MKNKIIVGLLVASYIGGIVAAPNSADVLFSQARKKCLAIDDEFQEKCVTKVYCGEDEDGMPIYCDKTSNSSACKALRAKLYEALAAWHTKFPQVSGPQGGQVWDRRRPKSNTELQNSLMKWELSHPEDRE